MNETEWLEGNDVRTMIRLVADRWSNRKAVLFVALCCQRVTGRMKDGRTVRTIELAELYGDGRVGRDELRHAIVEATESWREAMRWADEVERGAIASGCISKYLSPDYTEARRGAWAAYSVLSFLHYPTAFELAHWVSGFTRHAAGDVAYSADRAVPPVDNPERMWQGLLLNEMLGNPFRPVAFDPAWRSDTALSLARGMYDSRDFSPMPILADALQDAGCTSDDILDHCRGPGPHVRGCWVVDMVLGKE
jgi:hypothetical protein